MESNNNVVANQSVKKDARLPCRGCTRKYTNFDRCDGKPWRLIKQ